MTLRIRERLRWMRMRCLYPLNRVGFQIKKAAQRFVIKTVEKNASLREGMGSSLDHAGLMISLLRARRKSEESRAVALQAIPVKDFLLTSHPQVDFFYHRSTDLAETAWIIRGDYEPNVSAWILSKITREDRVLIVGGGQGYHALTVAKRLEAIGQLVVVAFPTGDLEAFELNFRTNRLDSFVQLHVLQSIETESFPKDLYARIQEFSPTIILVDQRGGMSIDPMTLRGFGTNRVFAVANGEIASWSQGSGPVTSAITMKVA
jgi:hypothetical protein